MFNFSNWFSTSRNNDPINKREVQHPEGLTPLLMNVVKDAGSPEKDFKRNLMTSTQDGSSVSISRFIDEKKTKTGLSPISVADVVVKLTYSKESQAVKAEITRICTETPKENVYLVGTADISDPLESLQGARILSDMSELYSQKKSSHTSSLDDQTAQAVLEGAELDGSFLDLRPPLAPTDEKDTTYLEWLDKIFRRDQSIEAKKIKEELAKWAAQSPYNHFVYHLLTARAQDNSGTTYRPDQPIVQTSLSYNKDTHEATLVLSAVTLCESVIHEDDPMSTTKRYYDASTNFNVVDDESQDFSQWQDKIKQAMAIWQSLNQAHSPVKIVDDKFDDRQAEDIQCTSISSEGVHEPNCTPLDQQKKETEQRSILSCGVQ